MSLPRYAEYKDSGVEWLGKFPAHWIIMSVKYLASRISSGKTPLGGSETYVDEGVTFLRSQNVYDEGLRLEDVVFISRDVDNSMAGSRVQSGDILLNITGASIGRSCLVPDGLFSANVNQHVCVVRLKDASQIPFVGWAFKSATIKNQIDIAQNGAAREGLNFDQIGRMIILMPPLPEQSGIATFLDHETAKIDALISEQKKLLALLAEKRQATISHAVTRGLNPNASMKDSGVPWLGEVPAHWQIKRVKHVKADTPNAFVDGPFGSNLKSEHFVQGGDVYVIESNFATQNKIDEGALKTISQSHFETISRSEVVADDIVIAKIGAQFGKASILPQLGKRSVVSGNSLKLTVNSATCMVKWVHLQLVNLKAVGEIDLLANGSAQPALSLGGMNTLPVVLPPLPEQIEVLEFLAGEVRKLTSLKDSAEHAIQLLRERRSALIAAAVTGKIDVRNLDKMAA